MAGLLAVAVIGAGIATQYGAVIDRDLPGESLYPGTERAVAGAGDTSLGGDASEAAPGEREQVSVAFEEASQSAFRLGMGVCAALAFICGTVSVVRVRNPKKQPQWARRRPEVCDLERVRPGRFVGLLREVRDG